MDDNTQLKDIYLRNLTSIETNAFFELKKRWRIATNVGVIRKCIVECYNLYKENENLKRDLNKKNSELFELKNQMGTICESFDVIKNFKKKYPNY